MSDPIGDGLRLDCKAYWKLEEATGTRVDATVNGHDFTPTGTPTSAAGKLGDAVLFDGSLAYTVDQQYLVATGHADLGGGDAQDFAIAGWFKLTSDTYDLPSFFAKGEDTGGIEYLLSMSGNYVTFTIGLSTNKNCTSTVSISNGTWYHFIAWHDTASDTCYLSVNGETPVADDFAGVSGGSFADNAANVLCGAAYETSPYDFLDGAVDEMGFWHRVLTPTERAYLYNSGTGVALYPVTPGTTPNRTLANLRGCYTASTGTGDVVLGAAIPGLLDLTGITDGATVSYAIRDGNQSEVGHGTWASGTSTLSRTTVLKSTNSDAAIDIAGPDAQVRLTLLAEDMTAAQVGAPALVSPSVSGNFVSFSSTAGAQADSGKSAASFHSSTVAYVAPVVPSVQNNVVVFSSSVGALADSGIDSAYVLQSQLLGYGYVPKGSSVSGTLVEAFTAASVLLGNLTASYIPKMSTTAQTLIDSNARTSSGALLIGSSVSYTQIDADGTLTLVGAATAWDDLRVEPTVRGAGTKVPSYTAWKGGLFAYAFDNAVLASEKEINFKIQMPHAWAAGTNIHIHIHWTPSATGSATEKVEWGLEYNLANVNGTFSSTNTTITASDPVNPPSTTPTVDTHYLTEFAEIDMTGYSLSTFVLGRLYRASSSTGDTYTGTAYLIGIDAHYQIDSFGSRDELSK